MSMNYPATFEHADDGTVLVRFPDFPEALTFGRTMDDARAAAADCLREALRGRMADDEHIPTPSRDVPWSSYVHPPAEVAAKAGVYAAFRHSGLTKTALAARMKLAESEVRRILDPNSRTKLARLEEVAAALGGRIEVGYVPLGG